MTNPKSVNDYFIPARQGWFWLVQCHWRPVY